MKEGLGSPATDDAKRWTLEPSEEEPKSTGGGKLFPSVGIESLTMKVIDWVQTVGDGAPHVTSGTSGQGT